MKLMEVSINMEPIFDNGGQLKAWLKNDVIYDQRSKHQAFIRNGSVFRYDGRYLGTLSNGYFWDKSGRAVGFMKGARGRSVPSCSGLPAYTGDTSDPDQYPAVPPNTSGTTCPHP